MPRLAAMMLHTILDSSVAVFPTDEGSERRGRSPSRMLNGKLEGGVREKKVMQISPQAVPLHPVYLLIRSF